MSIGDIANAILLSSVISQSSPIMKLPRFSIDGLDSLSKVLIGAFYLEYTYLIYWYSSHCQWERKYGTENCGLETTKGVISVVNIPGRDINKEIIK